MFAAGGAIAREESRVEDRPFTQMVGGEPVTFIRRVEVTEREAAPLFSAGLCLGWAADLGRGWVLEGNLGPAAGRPRDAWGAGGRASLSLAIDAGGFVLLARIAAELFKARDWEGGLAAGVGAALRF